MKTNVPDTAILSSKGGFTTFSFAGNTVKFLLKGRFVDNEGFTCANASVIAKRFAAADGTSAVIAWNTSEKPVDVQIEGLGAPTKIAAPGTASVDGPLAADSIRLYVFAK